MTSCPPGCRKGYSGKSAHHTKAHVKCPSQFRPHNVSAPLQVGTESLRYMCGGQDNIDVLPSWPPPVQRELTTHRFADRARARVEANLRRHTLSAPHGGNAAMKLAARRATLAASSLGRFSKPALMSVNPHPNGHPQGARDQIHARSSGYLRGGRSLDQHDAAS